VEVDRYVIYNFSPHVPGTSTNTTEEAYHKEVCKVRLRSPARLCKQRSEARQTSNRRTTFRRKKGLKSQLIRTLNQSCALVAHADVRIYFQTK
jgi:hypothetical protein